MVISPSFIRRSAAGNRLAGETAEHHLIRVMSAYVAASRLRADTLSERRRRCVAGLPTRGSPILLEKALYSPAHSLIDQSLHSTLGAEATNGDGFGIGWYDDQPTPGVFRSIEPAWNDQNLRELAAHVTSGHFFAHIRAAIGSAVQQTNCHPFRHGRWLFMHNGYIDELAPRQA